MIFFKHHTIFFIGDTPSAPIHRCVANIGCKPLLYNYYGYDDKNDNNYNEGVDYDYDDDSTTNYH